MHPQFATMDFFLPQSDKERLWFAAVSANAGVCEQIICRGFPIDWLSVLPLT